MSVDVIEGSGYKAKVNYCSFNQRIVINFYEGDNLTELVNKLKSEAEKRDYGKIWGKIRVSDRKEFADMGFILEAVIKDFYIKEDAVIMAFYTDSERRKQKNRVKGEEILTALKELENNPSKVKLDNNYKFRLARPEEAKTISKLYEKIFTSYPTPVFEAEYIKKNINDNVVYGLIYKKDQLVAAAAADKNREFKNAEMTDFATLPEVRGNGFASYILNELEKVLKERNYHTLYSIARATSYGMNKVFKLAGYKYGGRLIQNCHIAGDFEDMNLWYKVIN